MTKELKDMIHTVLLAITVHIEKIKELEKLVEQHSRALLLLGDGYRKHKKAIKQIQDRLEKEDIEEAEEEGMSLGSEDSWSSEEDSDTDDKEFIASSDEDEDEDEDMSVDSEESEVEQECCKRKRVD